MRLLLALALFAASVHAQIITPSSKPATYPAIQFKNCPYNYVTIYAQPCTFDKPVTAGDLIIVAALGCNTDLLYWPPYACALASDEQGDNFQIANMIPQDNFIPLLYALNAKGGPTTINFMNASARLAMIAEYPPSTGLDDSNWGTYDAQNPNGDPQGQSSDTGSTRVVVASQPGELLVAWGLAAQTLIGDGTVENAEYTVTAGPGFMMRGQLYGGVLAFEDSITTVPGAYFGTILWGGYGHWDLGMAAFKMVTPLVVKGCVN